VNLAHLAKLGFAAAAAIAVLVVFYRLERRGRSIVVAQTIVVVLVLDASLYSTTAPTTLISVFHLSFGGQNIRLTQVLLLLALIAKLCARGWPRRLDAASGWWLAFFVWYASAAFVGLSNGNAKALVVSRAFLVIEAGGMIVLTSSVSIEEWLSDRGLARLLRVVGVIAGVMFVLATTHVRINAHLPYLPLAGFGDLGPDAATIFLSLGLIGLAMEATRRKRRRGVLLSSAVLVVAHSASAQRATRLDLVVAVVVFVLIVLLPRRRRFFVRGGELVLVALAIMAVFAAPVFARAVRDNADTSVLASVPIVSTAAHVASTSYRQGSVQSRYNEWAVAFPLIRQSPLTGYGLGETFTHYDVGTRSFITYDITNNIGLDLLVRTGAAGLALFLMALITTMAAGWRAWRDSPVDESALLAAMASAVLLGLLGKGMVESILNEYHLTPLLGLIVGLILASGLGVSRSSPAAPAAPAAVEAQLVRS
jgi:O-antigen ligase